MQSEATVPELEVRNLHKTFVEEGEQELLVLDDIDLVIEQGSFTSIMGPSGCGKSTLLNILAGIIPHDDGEVLYHGEPVSPGDLPVGYIFQEPRLLDWRTVAQNIRIAMDAKGIERSQQEAIIDRNLQMVGLLDEKDSYPLRLSGGMRQRVGIARALSIDPDILLMDEPFSELDELTARNLREDVLELWEETGKTVVFVTHDISEAILMSDKIILLDTRGKVFKEVDVPHPRPRDPEDPELLQTEAEIMGEFFDHMEGLE